MKKFKVLIADDEEDFLILMQRKISWEGYDVITASDGQEAWEKIKSESPDVIVLDLTMPKMDGFSVLKKVRENPHPDKWQPVIILSARDELKDMKEGLALDADHYITKPFDSGAIARAIKSMISLIPLREPDKGKKQ